jgi:SOS-response transcriptional repressor LexA
MNYGTILAKLRKEKGFTQPEVADYINQYSEKSYSNKTVSHWEKGVVAPPVEQFLLMCELYSVTDIQAAFRDKSTEHSTFSRLNEPGKQKVEEFIEMLSGNPLYSKIENHHHKKAAPRLIRLYDLPASAGHGFYLDSENYEEIELDDAMPSVADYAIHIGGDSMLPRFVNGQMVFIKEQRTLNTGEIGIFALNGESFIKKLGSGELLSLNPNYKPIPINEFDSFYILGKVLG